MGNNVFLVVGEAIVMFLVGVGLVVGDLVIVVDVLCLEEARKLIFT